MIEVVENREYIKKKNTQAMSIETEVPNKCSSKFLVFYILKIYPICENLSSLCNLCKSKERKSLSSLKKRPLLYVDRFLF